MKAFNYTTFDPCGTAVGLSRRAIKIMTLATLGLASATADAATLTTIVPNGMTVPLNGFIANTNLLDQSGLPLRHLWVSDHLQGLCRIDPALNSGATTFALNPNTCTLGGGVAFDPTNNLVYIADEVANKTNQGLVRKTYNPGGDNGQGSISAAQFRLGDTGSCGVSSNRPSGMTLGPDGSLYLTFLKNGNIMRVNGPSSASVPCANFQSSIVGNGRRNFGATFVGHDLYILGEASPGVIENGDTCSKAGQLNCVIQDVFTDVALLPGGIGSNQIGTTPNGTSLIIADFGGVHKIEDPSGPAPNVILNWATGMSNPSSITPDITGLANPDFYVADDPTGGNGQLQGRVFKVTEFAGPVAPVAPTNVSAVAGDTQATVSWTPGSTGSAPTSRYTIHIFDGSGTGEVALPQSTTTIPPPTSWTVTGLTNDPGSPDPSLSVSYAFKVEAVSADGTSPLSALSNAVSPKDAGAPSQPGTLSGSEGDSAVVLGWGVPASNGGAPIESYTVSYTNLSSLSTSLITVPSTFTGTTVTGLTNGTSYDFYVYATNSSGWDGSPSNTLRFTPNGALPSLNMSLTMTGPDQVQSGSTATYTNFVSNTGGLPVDGVRVEHSLPPSGFGSASATTTAGACFELVVGKITCELGPMAAATNATVTVNLTNVTTELNNPPNSATVFALGPDGSTVTESNLNDNTASVSTTIAAPPPAPEPVTDLQINSGSAQAGAVDSSTSTTWSLKNGNGDAHHVVLTLSLPAQFTFDANGSTSICLGGANNTVVCSVGTMLAGAQTGLTVRVSSAFAIKTNISGVATFDGFDTDPNQGNNSRLVGVEFR